MAPIPPVKKAGLVLAVATLAVLTVVYVAGMLSVPTRVVHAVRDVEIAPRAAPDAPSDSFPLADHRLAFPVKGYRASLRDTFADDRGRGRRRHEALDIMAPRGTPVVAVDDGRVARVYRSILGGLGVYQLDRGARHVFYYAHLDGYAPGIAEGMELKRGDLVGFVGSTGNAPKHAPHLHFAMFELGADKRWWKGRAVDPYPLLKSE